eukprot:3327996-Rhodomonas_salina.1
MEREEEMAGRSEEGGEDRPPVSMQDLINLVNTAESMGREMEMAGQSREAGSEVKSALGMEQQEEMAGQSGKKGGEDQPIVIVDLIKLSRLASSMV